MDSIVARYRRPARDKELVADDMEEELLNPVTSGLSFKFAMPPVAHVRDSKMDFNLNEEGGASRWLLG